MKFAKFSAIVIFMSLAFITIQSALVYHLWILNARVLHRMAYAGKLLIQWTF